MKLSRTIAGIGAICAHSVGIGHLTTAAVIAVSIVALGCAGDPAARKQRYLESGNGYAESGRWREAVIEYRNALQIDARFAEARLKIAEAYVKLGDGRNAMSEFVRAADLLPERVDVQLTAGTYLLAAGQTDSALARAESALARQPDNIAAHILRGNALAGLNQLDNALTAMEEAIRLDPKRGATYTQLGIVEFARGKPEQAEAALKKAVALDPKSVSAQLALGNFYWASNRRSETEKAFEAALIAEPTNVVANRAMALLSMATGRLDKAEKHLKQVLETSATPAGLFALSDFYLATNRAKEAVALLEPYAEKRQPSVKHRLAAAIAASGDRARAHRLLDELLKADPRDAQAQLLKGQLLLDDGRSDDALSSVRSAVEIEPTSVAAQFALGKVYAARGDLPGAEKAFTEAVKLNPRAAAAQVELSRLQLASARPQDSIESAKAAVIAQPQNIDARIALVRGWLAAKELARADQEIEKLLAARPQDPRIHVLSGVMASARLQPAQAHQAFDRALAIDKRSVEALAGHIALDLGAKDFTSARKRIDARLADGAADPEVLVLAARTYAAMKDLMAAEEVLRRAIESSPSLLPAYAMLGQLYVSQRRLEEARKEFDALAERQSKPVGALTMSGIILLTQGNQALARQRFERAVALDSQAAVSANNLAWLYAESGEHLEQAVRLAVAASQALPEAPEVLDTLGWVYYKSDLPTLAVPPLMRAVEKSPNNPSYHYHLGLVYGKTGAVAQSRQSLTRALELKPDFAGADDARRALALLNDSHPQ
jgi:tetratricopeptide (TPR) repeat protein